MCHIDHFLPYTTKQIRKCMDMQDKVRKARWRIFLIKWMVTENRKRLKKSLLYVEKMSTKIIIYFLKRRFWSVSVVNVMVNLSNSSLFKWNSHFIIDWLGVGFSRPYMYLKNMDRLFVTTDDWNIFCLTKRSDEIKKKPKWSKIWLWYRNIDSVRYNIESYYFIKYGKIM